MIQDEKLGLKFKDLRFAKLFNVFCGSFGLQIFWKGIPFWENSLKQHKQTLKSCQMQWWKKHSDLNIPLCTNTPLQLKVNQVLKLPSMVKKTTDQTLELLLTQHNINLRI